MCALRRCAPAVCLVALALAPAGGARAADPAAADASAAAAPGARCAGRGPFPGADWPSVAAEVRTLRPAEVAALDAYAFTLQGADAERKGYRTDGLLVIHRGVVTYERYGRGFGPDTPHLAWSVSKSVTQALVGAAVARGALSVDDSLCKHLPGAPPRHCGITVRHLMEAASGLDWRESYEGLGLQTSSVLAMLYGEGHRDMAAFVLSHEARAAPGTRWNYSSGDAVLLAAVVDGAMKAAGAGDDWPAELLFRPLGMRSATLERDATGTPIGSSYVYATPRDLARVGWLFAQRGCWQGRPVLPGGWVEEATQVAGAFRRPGGAQRRGGGACGWDLWLNRPVPELGWPAPWPGAFEDVYAARGHWGQEIVVVPSLEMVIVRTADDRQGKLGLGRLVELAMAAGRLP
jgi:CubicO group peptidase (beta-lactamase class C family)